MILIHMMNKWCIKNTIIRWVLLFSSTLSLSLCLWWKHIKWSNRFDETLRGGMHFFVVPCGMFGNIAAAQASLPLDKLLTFTKYIECLTQCHQMTHQKKVYAWTIDCTDKNEIIITFDKLSSSLISRAEIQYVSCCYAIWFNVARSHFIRMPII